MLLVKKKTTNVQNVAAKPTIKNITKIIEDSEKAIVEFKS